MVLKYQDLFEIICILVKQSDKTLMSIFEINEAFKHRFHNDIPFEQFHFKSLREFLQSYKGLRFYHGVQGNYFSIRTKYKPIPNEFENLFSQLLTPDQHQVIAEELIKKFGEKHGTEFNLSEYDTEELVAFLVDTFANVIDETTPSEQSEASVSDVKVVNKMETSKEAIEELNNILTLYESKRLPKIRFIDSSFNTDFVPPGFEMRTISILRTDPTKLVPIMVYEVYDVSKFWFQFTIDEMYDEFTSLMAEIKYFYDESKRYLLLKVHQSHLLPNLVCIIYYEKSDIMLMEKGRRFKKVKNQTLVSGIEYHRALIVRVIDNDKYHCYFFDYGAHRTVKRDSILYMYRKFAQLPIQAIRGRVADIRPVEMNSMWPYKSIMCFKSWLKSKSYCYAQFVEINKKDKFTTMLLFKSRAHDLYKNSVSHYLIQNNLAANVSTAYRSENVSLCVPNVYCYPTFLEIENNVYPSAKMHHQLLRKGIPIDKLFYFYMNCSTIKNYSELMEEAEEFLTGKTFIGD